MMNVAIWWSRLAEPGVLASSAKNTQRQTDIHTVSRIPPHHVFHAFSQKRGVIKLCLALTVAAGRGWWPPGPWERRSAGAPVWNHQQASCRKTFHRKLAHVCCWTRHWARQSLSGGGGNGHFLITGVAFASGSLFLINIPLLRWFASHVFPSVQTCECVCMRVRACKAGESQKRKPFGCPSYFVAGFLYALCPRSLCLLFKKHPPHVHVAQSWQKRHTSTHSTAGHRTDAHTQTFHALTDAYYGAIVLPL